MRTAARPPQAFPLRAAPAPRASWPPPPPFAPGFVPPPSSRRGSTRQLGPRPGAGGTPPPGHPPARSRLRGQPQPEEEEEAAEEQPEAPGIPRTHPSEPPFHLCSSVLPESLNFPPTPDPPTFSGETPQPL
ncbi:basic proline-rich protein-like [Sus scrofa]|uniref:basic proline-rich protein-like n=1 Tax=Sus scrofa TaxID=9823 RepID=UPI000A2B353A|nr:basic proline-rich protein-like [Sus scrofa]